MSHFCNKIDGLPAGRMPVTRTWRQEHSRRLGVVPPMKPDTDTWIVATRLVEELGEAAVRVSKVKLVELIATNNLHAAAFWRDVMHAAERILAERKATGAPVH